jgi:hypothetical protein
VDRIAYVFFASTTINFHFLKSNLHFLRQSFWRTTPVNNFVSKLVFPIPITFLTRTSGVRLPARFFPLLRVFSLGSAPCSRFTSLRLLVFFMSVCVRAHMMWTRCVFCMCVCVRKYFGIKESKWNISQRFPPRPGYPKVPRPTSKPRSLALLTNKISTV